MIENVSAIEKRREEGSLYPYLAKGSFMENMRLKFIIKGWVGVGNIAEVI